MKYYLVTKTEYSGYDCNGHAQLYIVAAHSAQEAHDLLDDRTPNPEAPDGYWENDPIISVKELVLPDLSRKKKARVYY